MVFSGFTKGDGSGQEERTRMLPVTAELKTKSYLKKGKQETCFVRDPRQRQW